METRGAKCIKDVLMVPLDLKAEANKFKPCSCCSHTSHCFAKKKERLLHFYHATASEK